MAKNIIFFCAHDDDITVTLGTVLKYVDEGKNIIQVIFSQGAMSHPHLKEEVIVDIRKKEMAKVARQAGIKEVIHLDLKDMDLKNEIKKPIIKNKVKSIIEKLKPEKIFTLSSSETHPDHRAVNGLVLKVVDSLKEKYAVYTFNVWTIPKVLPNPILYVDISRYFWRKLKIMKHHKSQWLAMYLPQIIPVMLRAKYYGIKNNCKYAEKFEKVR